MNEYHPLEMRCEAVCLEPFTFAILCLQTYHGEGKPDITEIV